MDRYRQFSLCLVCGLACSLAGCCTHCGRFFGAGCADIVPGAIPQPPGAHSCAWQTTQQMLAECDDFVIYQYEWKGETSELGPFGQRHVAELMHRVKLQPYSIVVEPSENYALDYERQAKLTMLLAAHGVPDPELRVSIGHSAAEGLSGQEAPRLERGYFRSGARQVGGGGFGGGGFF